MSNIGCLLGAMSWLMTLNVKYKKISAEPERKANTVYFGVYSIITSIFTCGMALLCFWGIFACANALDSSGLGEIVIYVFIVILVLCVLLLLAELILGGFMGFVYQRRCNSRPVAWIALAVFAVAVALMIVGLLLIANATGIADVL